MADINVAPPPWQVAFDTANKLAERQNWLAKNRNKIRSMYSRVAGIKISEARLDRLAADNEDAWGDLNNMIEYDQYREIYEGYAGRKKFTTSKKGGARNRRLLSQASNFYGNIRRKHKSVAAYTKHIDARTEVDELRGTAESRRMVSLFGYNNLVKAYEGRTGFTELRDQADFFGELDPVMRQRFGRGATLADVKDISSRFGSASNYQSFLTAGATASAQLAKAREQDLGAFGGGGITQEALQQELFAGGGQVGDLQRQIEEARLRRQAEFTGAASGVRKSQEGGTFKLPGLF